MALAFQLTRGRTAAKQAQALSAGARVSATLVAATGPKVQVTGARRTPINGPEVFESRLAPCGTFTAPEKKTLCRWAIAQAGQAMNQTSCPGSPHPQESIEEGWPDQTCHHRTTAGIVKQARATRWKAIVRRVGRPRSMLSAEDAASAVARRCGTALLWPDSPRMVSSAGCVDTSIPLVTAAERTAGSPRDEVPHSAFL